MKVTDDKMFLQHCTILIWQVNHKLGKEFENQKSKVAAAG